MIFKHYISKLFKSEQIRANEDLIEQLRSVYYLYRESNQYALVNIEFVKEALLLFRSLYTQLDVLKDSYEFRRRLIDQGQIEGDIEEVIRPIEKLIVNTLKWLDEQEQLDASQAENILHNLYYIIELHSFDKNAKPIFNQVEIFCKKVTDQGVLKAATLE
ncbi:hypothetical protein [Pseudoalteromonas luteoviolacea]|uniref:hypothetical protein n=1 Tax=Pseudoalteromonas luteoviolacea TaxID=43657 RepID=UPI001B396F9E|nr:hypothetical protein [Pseudoalteromonas luteoviolacea]MBQ4839822.1 hypothetical protein [Pseudoalteromonas luteoviolacea]